MLTTDLPTATGSRAQAAAILRAVADLIETQPGIAQPGARIHFIVAPYNTPDVPGVVASVVSALPPASWRAEFRRNDSIGEDWLSLECSAGTSIEATEVTVSAPASAVATADGTTTVTTRTVTAWQPHPAIAALPGVTVDGAR